MCDVALHCMYNVMQLSYSRSATRCSLIWPFLAIFS